MGGSRGGGGVTGVATPPNHSEQPYQLYARLTIVAAAAAAYYE